MKKACKNCNMLTEADKCLNCGSNELSNRWSGMVIIINPDNSEVAKKLDIKLKGEYALMVG